MCLGKFNICGRPNDTKLRVVVKYLEQSEVTTYYVSINCLCFISSFLESIVLLAFIYYSRNRSLRNILILQRNLNLLWESHTNK